ncbi:hypothetical protein PCAR4_150144 [Paraburkholderia caribensis]|nr:hypothetical protein PCAR4_150144 [Paraburkholderia caribensis]
MRFLFAAFFVVILREHDFKFDEIAETVDAIQVNPRAPDDIDVALLRDDAARRECSGEQRVHRFGVRHRAARVVRRLRAVAVVALIEDQFGGRAVVELAQLQTAARHVVEKVLLAKNQRSVRRKRSGALAKLLEVLRASFDFDVACHVKLLSKGERGRLLTTTGSPRLPECANRSAETKGVRKTAGENRAKRQSSKKPMTMWLKATAREGCKTVAVS